MDTFRSVFECCVARVCLIICLVGVPAILAECEAPPDIDGAQHNLTGSPPYPEQTVVSYDCTVGYRQSGTSRTFECTESAWVGGTYECTEILCDFISPPQHGMITNSPTYEVNSLVVFGCEEGYELHGHASRRCMLEGWAYSQPRCDVMMCNEFVGVANGRIFQESPDGVVNDYDSEITVTCDEGYILSGPSRVTCGADGLWSESPSCDRSTCQPYPLSNSTCTKIYSYYESSGMYYLYCVDSTEEVSATQIGPNYALCYNNAWTDTTMACFCNCKVRADLTKITLNNVDSYGFLHHGGILSWSCKNGGTKESNDELKCNDGAMGEPVCIMTTTTSTTTAPTTSTTTTAPSISATTAAPYNGASVVSEEDGAQATTTTAPVTASSTSPSASTTSDAATISIPIFSLFLSLKTSGEPTPVNSSNSTSLTTSGEPTPVNSSNSTSLTTSGEPIPVSSSNSTSLTTPVNSSNSTSLTTSGEPTPVNSSNSTSLTTSGEPTPMNSSNSTCLATSGGTSVSVPTILAECEAPPDIDGAQHNLTGSPPYPEHTIVSYDCTIGYRQSGTSRTFECTESSWIGGTYECTEILCDFISPPQHGMITNSPTYKVNSLVVFGCEQGYELHGHASRRCNLDGWTYSQPRCDVMMCNEFVGVANGRIFQESPDGVVNDYGSEITVTCDEGYLLSGPSRVACGADGQWSESPSCDRSTCQPYPVSNSACTKISMYYESSGIYYRYCVDSTEEVSATHIGPDYALCYKNAWTDTTMACFCNCKVRADLTKITLNNVDSDGFLPHGGILLWSCKNGGTKESNVELKCNDGVMGEPVCIIMATTSTTTAPTTSTTTTAPSISATTAAPYNGASVVSEEDGAQATTTTAPVTASSTSPSASTTSGAATISIPIFSLFPSLKTSGEPTPVNSSNSTSLTTSGEPTPVNSSNSTSLTISGGTSVSKDTGLLTVLSTRPASVTISVCSCACVVQKDNDCAKLFQIAMEIIREYKWSCRPDVDTFVCSLDGLPMLYCRLNSASQSANSWTEDATLGTRKSLKEVCKCQNVPKPRLNGAVFVDGVNSLCLLFILTVIRSVM